MKNNKYTIERRLQNENLYYYDIIFTDNMNKITNNIEHVENYYFMRYYMKNHKFGYSNVVELDLFYTYYYEEPIFKNRKISKDVMSDSDDE